MRDALRAKRYLQNAVVTAVDKGPGKTGILCPVVWHMLMAKTWPFEPARCKVVHQTEEEIMRCDIRHYEAKGWSRLARLYGCDAAGNPGSARIPHVYILIKLKSWTQRVIKGRPISPHTKIPLRWLYNIIATAHAWMLGQITTQRVGRMFTTREYPTRLREESHAVEAAVSPSLVTSRICMSSSGTT